VYSATVAVERDEWLARDRQMNRLWAIESAFSNTGAMAITARAARRARPAVRDGARCRLGGGSDRPPSS